MTDTTTEPKKITLPMSERRPLRVVAEDWPLIAWTHDYDSEHESQANRHYRIRVRQHADGRTAVYCSYETAFPHERSTSGGFLLTAEEAQGDELIRAIRRAAGIIDRPELAAAVINDLPAEEDGESTAQQRADASGRLLVTEVRGRVAIILPPGEPDEHAETIARVARALEAAGLEGVATEG